MQLFNGSPHPVIIHDGIRIFHANAPAIRMFGFIDLESIKKRTLFDLKDDVSLHLAIRRSEKLRKNPDVILGDAQYIFRRPDGTRFIGIAHTRPYHWAFRALNQLYPVVFWSSYTYVKEVEL